MEPSATDASMTADQAVTGARAKRFLASRDSVRGRHLLSRCPKGPARDRRG
jgi:hypothetical protein